MIAIFPEIAACAAAGDSERLAVLVRKYFGGGETFAPRLDVAAVLRNAGVGVERMAIDGAGALLAKDERGRFTIVAVATQGMDEQAERFLLAHMLGHYLLDVQPLIARGDWQVSGYREAACPLKRYVSHADGAPLSSAQARELRSDAFAGALLLPVGMLRRAQEKLKDLDRVASFFGVSKACLVRRLGDIGLGAAPVSFLDAEAKIGSRGAVAAAADGDSGVERIEGALVAPMAGESGMPRSYAASTYGNSEKAARAARSSSSVKDQSPSKAETPTARATPRASSATPGVMKRDQTTKTPSSATSTRPPAPGAVADEMLAAARPASSAKAALSGVGMDRLREIARRLDKAEGK